MASPLPGGASLAAASGTKPAAQVDGRLSWGVRLPGPAGALLSPWAAFSLSEEARHVRAGLALEGPARLSLALDRRESAGAPTGHGILLRLDTRF